MDRTIENIGEWATRENVRRWLEAKRPDQVVVPYREDPNRASYCAFIDQDCLVAAFLRETLGAAKVSMGTTRANVWLPDGTVRKDVGLPPEMTALSLEHDATAWRYRPLRADRLLRLLF